jgi:glycyl-tRNA synthetase beta subunit
MLALYTPANRVDKMLGKHYNPQATLAGVLPDVFEHEAERVLYRALAEVSATPSTVGIMRLAPLVESFFEGVMIMSEIPAVRDNRLALLSVLHRLYLERYGRLSCLVMTT